MRSPRKRFVRLIEPQDPTVKPLRRASVEAQTAANRKIKSRVGYVSSQKAGANEIVP